MGAVTANISKGREVELYNRVKTNDGANSALIMLLLQEGGDTLAELQDYATVATMLAGPSNEVTVSGYARKTLTDSNLAAWAPDNTRNLTELVLPLQTFAALAAGETIAHVVVAYDPDTTGGTDSTLVPITIADTLIDGTTIPTLGDDIVVAYNALWVTAI